MIPNTNPLRTLKKINIETKDLCNRSCSFCPRSTYTDTGDEMSLEDYRLILGKLADYDYNGYISPVGNNEGLCDDRIVEIIRITRELLPNSLISIDTNGDLLTSDLLQDMVDAGLSQLTINHYDDSNADLYLLDGPINHRKVEEIPLYNRAGNVDVESRVDVYLCIKLFHKMAISHKGDALLCCADWFNVIKLGNVITDDIAEIWNLPLRESYREAHSLQLGHTMSLCDVCNRLNSEL